LSTYLKTSKATQLVQLNEGFYVGRIKRSDYGYK